MEQICCNKCGRQIKMRNGIPREDFLHIKKEWGYFSKKDGWTQEFLLCEACIEDLEREFVLPVKQYETTEML